MNKAFVREPEFDGKAYCPRCGSLGEPVGIVTLDSLVVPEARSTMMDSAWFCGYARCDVAYFNLLEVVITTDQLRRAVYPKDPSAPLCPCFGFTLDDIEADVRDGMPHRIRALRDKSQGPDARCASLAPNGRCCLKEVQRLYMRMRG